MTKELIQLKKNYNNYLDKRAKNIAKLLKENKKVSELLLDYISDLYDCANTEKDFSNSKFQSAYHQPITADLEFLLARIFYHYSIFKKLNWVISLRKQKKNIQTGKLVAPDIKIEKDNKIVAIIEVKAKAGWMQTFFSKQRELKDKKMGRKPEKKIQEAKEQLLKYSCLDDCNKSKVFVFLPTFIHVSRKKYKDTIENYRKTFAKNSTLNKNNLIILSKNISLNLSSSNPKKDEKSKKDGKPNKDYEPTNDFENFIKLLTKIK